MCSAMGQQKLVVEAIELGAKDFIVKPFDEKRYGNSEQYFTIVMMILNY